MSDADIECEFKDLMEQPLVKRTKKSKRSLKRKGCCKLKRKNLICILTLLALVLLLLGLCLYMQRPSRFATFTRYKPKKAVMTILLWNPLDGDARWTLPQDTVYTDYMRNELGCGIPQCIVTNDRQFENHGLRAFDAILLNAADAYNTAGLRYSKTQYQVFVDKHVVKNNGARNLSQSINFYNMTMTYKLNSHRVAQNYELFINGSYAYALPDNSTSSNLTKTTAQYAEKTSMALFIVNPPCHYKSMKQGLLLKAIKEHLEVDIVCEPVDNPTFSKYKFFLTFEDALCENFLSNNFYKAIQNGVVPVVLAGGNYTRYLPYGTSINAEVFPTMLDLVDYLLALEQNAATYAKYLSAAYKFLLRPESSIFCRLCSFLHQGEQTQGSYNVPSSWWQSIHCQLDSKMTYNDDDDDDDEFVVVKPSS